MNHPFEIGDTVWLDAEASRSKFTLAIMTHTNSNPIGEVVGFWSGQGHHRSPKIMLHQPLYRQRRGHWYARSGYFRAGQTLVIHEQYLLSEEAAARLGYAGATPGGTLIAVA